MVAASPDARARSEAIEHVATTLLQRASLLTRLLLRLVDRELSRAEAGMLATLARGPRRITELAETEGLAQPTVTQLADRLQGRGLVSRERDPDDGRVVLVSLTAAGGEALERFRAQYVALLRGYAETLPDAELEALAGASDALERMIEGLQAQVDR